MRLSGDLYRHSLGESGSRLPLSACFFPFYGRGNRRTTRLPCVMEILLHRIPFSQCPHSSVYLLWEYESQCLLDCEPGMMPPLEGSLSFCRKADFTGQDLPKCASRRVIERSPPAVYVVFRTPPAMSQGCCMYLLFFGLAWFSLPFLSFLADFCWICRIGSFLLSDVFISFQSGHVRTWVSRGRSPAFRRPRL